MKDSVGYVDRLTLALQNGAPADADDAQQEQDHRDHEEEPEENRRDSNSTSGNSTEPKQSGNDRDDKKNYSPS